MDAADFERLKAHLEKHKATDSPCPVCASRKWEALGPQTLMAHQSGLEMVIGGPVVPVVLLVCTTCWYIRPFAWLPISKGAGSGE